MIQLIEHYALHLDVGHLFSLVVKFKYAHDAEHVDVPGIPQNLPLDGFGMDLHCTSYNI